MLNLDTHIFVDAIRGSLDSDARSAMARDRRWGISDIVLWEIEMLHAHRRFDIGVDDPRLVDFLDALEIWPMEAA